MELHLHFRPCFHGVETDAISFTLISKEEPGELYTGTKREASKFYPYTNNY